MRKSLSGHWTHTHSLDGAEDRVIFSQEHKGVFFITKQFQLFRGWGSEKAARGLVSGNITDQTITRILLVSVKKVARC